MRFKPHQSSPTSSAIDAIRILFPVLLLMTLVTLLSSCATTQHKMLGGEIKYIKPQVQPFLSREESTPGFNVYGSVNAGQKEREDLDIKPYVLRKGGEEYKWPDGTKNLKYETASAGLDVALEYDAPPLFSFLLKGSVRDFSTGYLAAAYTVSRFKQELGPLTLGADFGLGLQKNDQTIEYMIETLPGDTSDFIDRLLYDEDTTYNYAKINGDHWGLSYMLNLGVAVDLGLVEPYFTLSYLDLPNLIYNKHIPTEAYLFDILSWDVGLAIKTPYSLKVIVGVSAQKINHDQSGSSFSGHLGLGIGL